MKIDIETAKKYQITWTGHVIQIDKLDPLVTEGTSNDPAGRLAN